MSLLYLDCGMGAAGDMLTAALLELCPDREAALAELNALGIPGVQFLAESAQKCGITGTHMRVVANGMEEDELQEHHSHEQGHSHTHDHSHSSLADIRGCVSQLTVSEKVRTDILAVYESIAAAESKVHGVSVQQIHFHEVGSMDALADVTAVCYLLERLGHPEVTASPVHVGSGHVFCAHGILPVPAPATAELLRGIPVYGGQIQGELCTPTGAALLKHFVSRFGNMPVMMPVAYGYGMGKKDFPMANCVRAIAGETGDTEDTILELRCNLDDMTAEDIGFAMEQLLRAGAPDVFTQPIAMKKNRPGILLTVLCRPSQREQMLALLFRHTSTLGIRETGCTRAVLTRREETAHTPWGDVRCKVSEGYGVKRRKAEYDDLARLATENDLSIAEVRSAVDR